MGPGKLSGLERGDRIELSSEVQVTVDCDKPSARCAGRPYDFDPHVQVSLELAARKSPAARSRVIARRTLSCRQRLPNRQHHCPVVLDRTTRIGDHFPCPLDRCYANVVVSASSPLASGDQRMIIGANKPNGRIVQNKSRLNAIRLAPGETARRLVTERLRRGSLRLRPRRKVVLSQKVDGLERGDVLAVAAALRSDVRHLGYNALVGGELVVARGPRAATPSRLVRRSVWQQGRISPSTAPTARPCSPRARPARSASSRCVAMSAAATAGRRRYSSTSSSARSRSGSAASTAPGCGCVAAGSRFAPTSRRARA